MSRAPALKVNPLVTLERARKLKMRFAHEIRAKSLKNDNLDKS